MKSAEGFTSLIIVLFFIIIIPITITQNYNDIYKQNDKEHHIEQMIWQIEQEQCVHLELLEYEIQIECFAATGEPVPYVIAKENKFPNNVKYVHIIYGEESRWIIFG